MEDQPGQRGRPPKYTPELAAEICRRLSGGESLRSVCADPLLDIDESSVREWALSKPEFTPHYLRARELGYLKMADDIQDISDDGSNDWMDRETRTGRIITVPDQEHIQRSKLRVDTRKWLLSKCLPKVYGDRIAIEHSGTLTLAERIRASRERIAPPTNDDCSDIG